jgi:hypothetical protein
MAIKSEQSLLFRIIYKFLESRKGSSQQLKKKKKAEFYLDKRQKFAIGVALLSFGFFFVEYAFNTYGLFSAFFLAIFSDCILFWAIRNDLSENFSIQVFILPFLYSLSFGFFSFLTPARLLTKLILTSLYALGLYSVFLSENIFIVASIRTIALLNSARIVSLVISLITFFFLANTTFSIHAILLPTIGIVFLLSLFLTLHAVWTYTLEEDIKKDVSWVIAISLCIVQLSVTIWFWPSSPTIVALFLTSIWYVLIGLSHVWFDKRLFRSVLWEYAWVSVIAFLVLVSFTMWQ